MLWRIEGGGKLYCISPAMRSNWKFGKKMFAFSRLNIPAEAVTDLH